MSIFDYFWTWKMTNDQPTRVSFEGPLDFPTKVSEPTNSAGDLCL